MYPPRPQLKIRTPPPDPEDMEAGTGAAEYIIGRRAAATTRTKGGVHPTEAAARALVLVAIIGMLLFTVGIMTKNDAQITQGLGLICIFITVMCAILICKCDETDAQHRTRDEWRAELMQSYLTRS